MPYLISIQDRHRRIHLREEEVDAAFNELMVQEAGGSGVMCGRLRRASIAFITILQHHGSQIRLLLRLSELGDNFGSAPLGAFLLRDSIVSARQSGLTAVSTWLTTIATDLFHELSGSVILAPLDLIIIPFDDGKHHKHALSGSTYW